MPSPDAILGGLTAIANQWRELAIGWHVVFGAALAALAFGWRPSIHLAGYALVIPLLSVSAAAWASGNPFNGSTFVLFAVALLIVVTGLSDERVRVAPAVFAVPGLLLVAFGWSYPHFVEAGSWAAYAYAAPLGVLPCPTLAAVIGLTLIFRGLESTAWSVTLAAAGFVYGAIGALRLGVTLDYGLLAGAAILAVSAAAHAGSRRRRAA